MKFISLCLAAVLSFGAHAESRDKSEKEKVVLKDTFESKSKIDVTELVTIPKFDTSDKSEKFNFDFIASVPEPTSYAMFIAGLMLICTVVYRRKSK
jgi:hypothetical protein